MIKKTITYEDLDGNKVTEDFWFHLNKLEMAEMDAKYGGLVQLGNTLSETDDALKAYNIFKDILLNSYGKRTDDGRRFHKKDPATGAAYRYDLEGSDALGEMILEMVDKPELAVELFQGLLPKGWQEEIKKEEAKNAGEAPVLATAPPVVEAPAELTDEELVKMKPQDMTKEQLLRAMQLRSSSDA